jgi:hypothetical protein
MFVRDVIIILIKYHQIQPIKTSHRHTNMDLFDSAVPIIRRAF